MKLSFAFDYSWGGEVFSVRFPIYLATGDVTSRRMAMKKPTRKDLPPKTPTTVKGGGSSMQDNITLVRSASSANAQEVS